VETRRWAWLEEVYPVAAPGLAGSGAAALDALGGRAGVPLRFAPAAAA
jgi:hypothetical protein